jgi:diadenosine tetraphosphatase ApaH/serine/threonine PP2A family protein phosphatase
MILETVKKIEQYTKEDVLHLLDRVNLLFNKEPRLLQLPKKPLIFVGDTHGDWKATQRLLFRYWETATVFVFLGDYVDRGPHQIENINLLFELKTKIPNRLMILRGNHETPKVNRSYGFYDTVQETLGNVIDQYWQTFAKMPLAAISRSQKIFAVHGGIPEQLVDIREINSLPREIELENPVTIQLLWNDPREALKGYGPSMRGSRIRSFGQDVTEEFMAHNSLELIVRAHEVFPHGYHEFFDGRILSLFSCRDYRCSIAGKALYVKTSGERELIAI